jgi:hypothetical protein
MILKALMEIGAKRASTTMLHCNAQPIVARLMISGDGDLTFAITEKGKREYGPCIRGTSSLKPGIGFYKWEHLLTCVCANRDKIAQKAGSAGSGLTEDAKNAENLKTLVEFTQKIAQDYDMSELARVVQILKYLEMPSVREKLHVQVVEANLPGGQFVTLEFADDATPWYQEQNLLAFWGTQGFTLSDGWSAQQSKKKSSTPKATKHGTKSNSEMVMSMGICSVTGKYSRLQRLAIKLDGWKDKPALAAFNRAAYCSRGLKQTFNAPLSQEAADLITKGWQYLIRKEGESHLKLEDQIYVFWGEPVIKPFGEQARDPKIWKDLLLSVQLGKQIRVSPEGFHVLGIGKHTSNAYVVAWLDKDARQTAQSIVRWGRWLTVNDKQARYHSLEDLIMALRPRKDLDRRMEGGTRRFSKHEMTLWRDLLRLAYGEGHVPAYVLHRLVERFSTELETAPLDRATIQRYNQTMSRKTDVFTNFPLDRLVLLNICLCSLNNLEEITVDILSNLDEKKRNAFNAGRLFNLICLAQQRAIGATGKTMLASNARLASTRPMHIIPEMITRLNSIYLPKLRRDDGPTAGWIDHEISELMRNTTLAPAHSAEQMGWFWKGFYHRTEKDSSSN